MFQWNRFTSIDWLELTRLTRHSVLFLLFCFQNTQNFDFFRFCVTYLFIATTQRVAQWMKQDLFSSGISLEGV